MAKRKPAATCLRTDLAHTAEDHVLHLRALQLLTLQEGVTDRSTQLRGVVA